MSCHPSRVVIQKRAARAQRLGQELAAVRSTVVLKMNSRQKKLHRPVEILGLCRGMPASQTAMPVRQILPRSRPPPRHPKNPAASRQRNQAISNRVHHQLRCLVNPERVHNIGAVHRDGVRAQLQSAAISLFDFPATIMLQNLQLPHRQSRIRARPSATSGFTSCGSRTVLPSATPFTAFQFQIHRILQNISARACLQRLPNQRVLRMHAQHQDRRVGHARANLPRSLDPADPGSAQSITVTRGFSSIASFTASFPSSRFADHLDPSDRPPASGEIPCAPAYGRPPAAR